MQKIILALLLSFVTFTIVAQEPEQETKYLNSKVKIRSSLDFAFTVGGGASYIPEQLSSEWAEPVNGLGLLYGFFGDANLMIKFSKSLGISLSGGQAITSVRKNYVTEGVFQYSTDQQVRSIPITLGLRTYLGDVFYLEPQVGYNLIKLDTETSENHPFGQYQVIDNGNKFIYGAAIGLDIRKGNFAINIATQFVRSDGTVTFGITQPFTYAGLRLGVGFASK